MAFIKEFLGRGKDTFVRKGFTPRVVPEQEVQVERELKKVLGPIDLTLLGIGSIVGAGVFVLTGEAAAEYAGPSIILSYLLSSIAALLLSLSYVEFAVDLPVTGGAFNFLRIVQGEFMAWQATASLIMEYMVSISAISKGFSGYLASLFGLDTEALVISKGFLVIDISAFFLVILLATLVYIGTKESALFNAAISICNICVIVFIFGASLRHIDNDNYSPFMPNGISNTFRAAAVVFFAYIGFDSVSTMAGEIKNPSKDMPLSVIAAVMFCTVLYVLMAAALVGIQSFKEIDKTAPFSEAFVSLGMSWAGKVIAIGALTGIVTSMLVAIMGLSRILIIIGREKLLPHWIGAVDEKRGTPKNALIVTGTIAGIMALLFNIDTLSRLVSMGTLFALGIVSVAAVQRAYILPDDPTVSRMPFTVRMTVLIVGSIVEGAVFSANLSPIIVAIASIFTVIATLSFYQLEVKYTPKHFVTPLKPLVPCLAIFAAIHFMFSLGWEAHLLFLIFQVFAFLVYFLYGMHRSGDPTDDPSIQLNSTPQTPKPVAGLLEGIAERSDTINPL